MYDYLMRKCRSILWNPKSLTLNVKHRLGIESNDLLLRTFDSSMTIYIRRVEEEDRWQHYEGSRNVEDFLDPTTGSVADNLTPFFFVEHGIGGCLFCKRFYKSQLLHVSKSDIHQYAEFNIGDEYLWTLCTPGLDSLELRVLASIASWFAMGGASLPFQYAYPDVYSQFVAQLRCPDGASPVDLLLASESFNDIGT